MVIPQTFGALLAFLTLVAPGILFENLRRRRRLGTEESAFREIARTAMASLLLTCLSIALLLAVNAVFGSALLDPRKWFIEGARYVQDHFYVVAVNLLAEVLLACGLAALADWGLHKFGIGTARITQGSAWDELFRSYKPQGTVPWVHVQLTDGSTFWGALVAATPGGKIAERELILESPFLTHRPPPRDDGTYPESRTIGGDWEFVVIPSSQIVHLRVAYQQVLTGDMQWTRRRLGALERDRSTGQVAGTDRTGGALGNDLQ